MPPKKNFRKRSHDDDANNPDDSEDEQHRRRVLEEVKFLQKQRERKNGIPAFPTVTDSGTHIVGIGLGKGGEGGEGGSEGKEEQVLQDTFAQETAVTIEDPNMLNYVERELAKKRGKNVDSDEKEEKDSPIDELYIIPDHLKVKKRNSEESSTQWTTGIAEIQLPIEFKLRNIEETEVAKKQLQEKRIAAKPKSDAIIPSSFNADFFHRGRDYAEKLKREHPELRDERGPLDKESTGKLKEGNDDTNDNDKKKPEGGRRETATDQLVFDRFRSRDKYRVMRK